MIKKTLIILCIILALLLIILKKTIDNLKNNQSTYKIRTSENTIWKNTNQYAKNSNFETINLPDEILSKINNKKDFDLAIKNYLNRYEFLDATIAEFESYEIDETVNCIIINFKLNNIYHDLFAVLLYLEDNSMEIVDVWSEEDWIDDYRDDY